MVSRVWTFYRIVSFKRKWNNIPTYCYPTYDWRKPLFYSSYILVMIAMDRFQAVCYPMNNHFWQPTRSKLKIVIAWILACIMCIPQAILFVETDTDHGTKTCTAQIGNNTSTGGKLSTMWPCLGHQYVSKKVRTKWNPH